MNTEHATERDALSRASRLRVPADLVVTFADGEPVAHLASSGVAFTVDAAALALLHTVQDPEQLESLLARFDRDSVEDGISQLIAAGLLIDAPPDGETGRGPADIVSRWKDWGESAWFFQLSTRNTPYETTDEGQQRLGTQIATVDPPPPAKCLCGSEILTVGLPPARVLPAMTVSDAFAQRRTCRNFSEDSIPLADVADMAFWTAGVLFSNDTDYFGTVLKKVAPSPGSRHGTELYFIANHVEGLEPGFYHYCGTHHAVTMTTRVDDPESAAFAALHDQAHFSEAAVSFFFTYVVGRLMWKYKAPVEFRLAHYEIGHYAQNLLLAGTALGHGVYSTGAFKDESVERLAQIDGVDEIVMYAAGAGRRKGRFAYARKNVVPGAHVPSGIDINTMVDRMG